MSARTFIGVFLAAFLLAGCAAEDSSTSPSAEGIPKASQEPQPEKSKAGKPNLNKPLD